MGLRVFLLLFSTQLFAAPMARVFTGFLELYGTKQILSVKLNVLPQVIPQGQKTETRYRALFTLSLGEKSLESIALYYETSKWEEATRTLTLESSELPTIVMQENGTESYGKYSSPLYGEVGRLAMLQGTKPPQLPVLPTGPVGGRYVGNCLPKNGASRVLQIRLIPTRIAFDSEPPADKSLSALHFQGDALCQSARMAGTCGLIHDGVYDIYRSEIVFKLRSDTWKCHRWEQNSLECESTSFQPCQLQRLETLQ